MPEPRESPDRGGKKVRSSLWDHETPGVARSARQQQPDTMGGCIHTTRTCVHKQCTSPQPGPSAWLGGMRMKMKMRMRMRVRVTVRGACGDIAGTDARHFPANAGKASQPCAQPERSWVRRAPNTPAKPGSQLAQGGGRPWTCKKSARQAHDEPQPQPASQPVRLDGPRKRLTGTAHKNFVNA